DAGCGAGGRVSTPLTPGSFLGAMRLAQQADGKILLAGTKFFGPQGHVLIRYNAEGSLDAGFGTAGIALGDLGTGLNTAELGLTLQPDGKIVVVGSISDNFAVVRYTVAGALDPSFGTNGRVTTEYPGRDRARAALVQPDGKIVVAGVTSTGPFSSQVSDFALARYNADGSLDAGFGAGGTLTTDFASAGDEGNGVLVQPDGKIVAVGKTVASAGDFAVARDKAHGRLGTTIYGHGKG